MKGPLVDAEGFPRSDIDVYSVRIARNRIICELHHLHYYYYYSNQQKLLGMNPAHWLALLQSVEICPPINFPMANQK